MDICPPVAILPGQNSTYTPVRKTETTSDFMCRIANSVTTKNVPIPDQNTIVVQRLPSAVRKFAANSGDRSYFPNRQCTQDAITNVTTKRNPNIGSRACIQLRRTAGVKRDPISKTSKATAKINIVLI